MLAVGRALMSAPKLLMLDEPSLGLAPLVVREIFRIIERLREQGTSILLIEQNARAALEVADHGYVLETGASRWKARPTSWPTDPRVIDTYLGAASQRTGRTVWTYKPPLDDMRTVIEQVLTRPVTGPRCRPSPTWTPTPRRGAAAGRALRRRGAGSRPTPRATAGLHMRAAGVKTPDGFPGRLARLRRRRLAGAGLRPDGAARACRSC
jgi:hypothetical protein